MLPARCALPTLAALAAAAIPSAAHAAAVSTDRACYSPGEIVTETGSGFTPSTDVTETLALVSPAAGRAWNFAAPPLTTDDQGGFTRKLHAPDLQDAGDRQEPALGAFADQANPSAPVMARWTLSAWTLRIKEWSDHVAKPGRSMTIDTYGWTTESGTLYAHYYRGTTHVKSVRIGATTGDCGNLKVKVPQFPVKKVKAGAYTLYVSRTASLDKAHDDWLRMKARVSKSAATA
jgi:hypothetical protein